MRSSLKWTLILAVAFVAGVALAVMAQTLTELPATSQINQTDPHMSPFKIEPNTIDWGLVTVTIPVTRSVNITNLGSNSTRLNMTSRNATGALENGSYALTWDAENLTLPSNGWLLANFTLTIYEANVTLTDQFSLDIWIGDQTE